LNDFKIDWIGESFAREYWTGKTYLIGDGISCDANLVLKQVPSHAVVVFAVRQMRPGLPLYLGSDLHISQGLEVVKWVPGEKSLKVSLHRPGMAKGSFELALPRPVSSVVSNGKPINWLDHGGGQYLFNVEFNSNADVEIYYE
jgi:hypothetical protein